MKPPLPQPAKVAHRKRPDECDFEIMRAAQGQRGCKRITVPVLRTYLVRGRPL